MNKGKSVIIKSKDKKYDYIGASKKLIDIVIVIFATIWMVVYSIVSIIHHIFIHNDLEIKIRNDYNLKWYDIVFINSK